VTLTSNTPASPSNANPTLSAALSSGSSQTAYATENGGNGSVNGNNMGTGAFGGLTLGSSSTTGSALSVGGGSTLSFAVGSSTNGNVGATPFSLANPNTNSTYLTVYSNGAGNIFANSTTADFVTITNLVANSATLSLTLDNSGAYLLIQTAGTNAGTNADFSNLLTSGGVGLNGMVVGVSDGLGGFSPLTLSMVDANGVSQSTTTPYDEVLYLDNGELLLTTAGVPEPGTWAILLGGLAMLFFVVRRRQAACAGLEEN
jgi:hypothetical protein